MLSLSGTGIGRGIVMKYAAGEWSSLDVDEDTDAITTAPSALEVSAYNNRVYATYKSGGSATLRSWQ